MNDFRIACNSPWYLTLLVLVPVVWVLSFRTLAGLGKVRRVVAIGLRTLVMTLLIVALSELQLQQVQQKLTVIYLLDQSESIPEAQRHAMLQYAAEEVAAHRDSDREDCAGLIVFGRDAAIEVQPYDDDLPIVGKLESAFQMATDATNLAAALKLAQATFPSDSAKRIVIVSDGNETLGDAEAIARMLTKEDGIGLDVVPIRVGRRAEVAVEKVTVPEQARKGQSIEARIVVNNLTQPTADDPGTVRGRLTLVRIPSEGEPETMGQPIDVELAPGKRVFTVVHEIDRPDFYTYEARFQPEDAHQDVMPQNNRATAFTQVRGKGSVLLIEDWEYPGEFDELVDRLLRMNIEVSVRQSNQLFTSLAQLQRFDCVILANVPRSSGSDTLGVTNFSDAQIQMLVRNTQQMGAGLIVLGGDRSYGAGGWANTELEKAMPVDCTIRNKKIRGVGALALLMHASEMSQGNHWQKVVAKEAIKGLGPMDYCGLIHWNDFGGGDDWLWKDASGNGMVRVGDQRGKLIARLSRMTPGDMPEFDPAMKKALAAFKKLPDASVKHMIIISDGDPSPPSTAILKAFRNAPPKGIQVTTVAIGTHGPPSRTPLQRIARVTGGRFYAVKNAKALPRIYQREVRQVTRPLVYEKPVQPRVKYRHEMLGGIDTDVFPQIKGFVLTTRKDNPLVEVSLVSPQPAEEKNATILASWTYGLGRVVALTTDAGERWADSWKNWEHYDKLFEQMVRWAMRPAQEQGRFTVATEYRDGKVRMVVTALDPNDDFLNFLNMSGSIVGPNMTPRDVSIRQTAPGRYMAEFEAKKAGSYFITIAGKMPAEDVDPAAGPASGKLVPFQLRTGVSVPYSEEFRNRQTNRALLTTLAGLKPRGGKPGNVIDGPMTAGSFDQLLATNTFRHNLAKALSSDDVWPYLLVFAACVFFADVLVRRVHVSFEWVGPLAGRARDVVFRREREPVKDERLERLRSRKAEVTASLADRRTAARFEPEPDAEVDADVIEAELAGRPSPSRAQPESESPGVAPEMSDEETYTARLLKAKREVWKDQDKPKE